MKSSLYKTVPFFHAQNFKIEIASGFLHGAIYLFSKQIELTKLFFSSLHMFFVKNTMIDKFKTGKSEDPWKIIKLWDIISTPKLVS